MCSSDLLADGDGRSAVLTRPAGKTLAQLVVDTAALAPLRPAILFGDRTISYREIRERMNEAARALLAAGVRPGDPVAALLGNDPDWVTVALAASAVGALFVPLNTWYKKAELAWTLKHCGVRVLVTARRFLKADYGQLFNELIPELADATPGRLRATAFPELNTVVFLGETPRGALAWSDFVAAGRGVPAPDPKAVEPDGPAYVLYTSGSTAEPKGVLLTHRGIVENGFDLGQRRAIVPEDRTWLGTPLFYALGATNALPATLTAGATLVLQGHFEAGLAIETIRRTGATVYYGTGNMSRALLDHPDYAQAKIGSLKKGNEIGRAHV